jgi:hypothetical protein
MSYHDLSECTLSDDERQAEARRLIEMIAPQEEKLSKQENGFIRDRLFHNCHVTVKQLFWLRDIKDRVL